MLVRSQIRLHTYGSSREKRSAETVGNCLGVYQSLFPFRVVALGHGAVRAQHTHPQTGSREGMSPHQDRVDPELLAQLSDLHLVELLDGLDDQSGLDHLFHQGDPVVVGFDDVGSLGAAGFYGVRIDGPLTQEQGVEVQAPGLLLEDPDKCVANDLSLSFGLDNAVQLGEKTLGCVHEMEVPLEPHGAKELYHLPRLVLPHEAVIDVEEVEPVRSQGVTEEAGTNRGVHPPRGQEEDASIAHLLQDDPALLFDVSIHGPGGLAAAHPEHKVGEHLLALLRVVHLGVELESVSLQTLVGNGRVVMHLAVRVHRGADFLETLTDPGHRVAVAHPHFVLVGKPGKDGAFSPGVELGRSVLTLGVLHPAAIVLGDLLVAIAEAYYRGVQVEDPAIVACFVAL